MKARLFFADKYRLTETEYRDKMAHKLLAILVNANIDNGRETTIKGSVLVDRLVLADGAKLREIVLYARTNLPRLLQHHKYLQDSFIVAGKYGYTITNDKDKIRAYKEALHVRAVHGLMAVQAMNEILNDKDDNELAG